MRYIPSGQNLHVWEPSRSSWHIYDNMCWYVMSYMPAADSSCISLYNHANTCACSFFHWLPKGEHKHADTHVTHSYTYIHRYIIVFMYIHSTGQQLIFIFVDKIQMDMCVFLQGVQAFHGTIEVGAKFWAAAGLHQHQPVAEPLEALQIAAAGAVPVATWSGHCHGDSATVI